MVESKNVKLKGIWGAVKWMKGQAGPFILSLLFIVVSGMVLSLCGVGVAVVSKNLVDAAVSLYSYRAALYAMLFILLIFVRVGLRSAYNIVAARTHERVSCSMRQCIFECLLRGMWVEFSKYHSEDYLTRLTSDVEKAADGIVYTLPDILSLSVGIGASFVTLLYFDPVLAFMVFLLVPLAILLSRIFGRKLKHMSVKVQESESAYRSLFHEYIQNMVVIRAFCIEKRSMGQIRNLHDERLGWISRRSRMGAAAGAVLSLGYWLGYFLAFGWGALQVSKGNATLGTFAAFLQLVEQIQGPFISLAYTLPGVISTWASVGRLMEIESMEPESDGFDMPCLKEAGVEFNNVGFSYEEEKPVFKNASVKIYPGDITALMGPSGEGKTTFVKLLLSLLKPESGHIYFTGTRGERLEASPSSRRLISYVPQGNTLFSGTIRENLRAGRPDAKYEELEEALKSAFAWDFVENLPEGIDTVIGERGLGLSEGQAQRIAIARAFIHKAPVLILDEATSALDVDTETGVLKAVKNLKPSSTCIVITHRPTALKICNRVLHLDDGRILEYENPVTEGPASEAV